MTRSSSVNNSVSLQALSRKIRRGVSQYFKASAVCILMQKAHPVIWEARIFISSRWVFESFEFCKYSSSPRMDLYAAGISVGMTKRSSIILFNFDKVSFEISQSD